MPMWGYYATGGMAWLLILSSLFWLSLAAVVVWALVRWLSGAARSPAPPTPQQPPASLAPLTALEVLKTRYARGEIDTATFRAMRAQLEESEDTAASSARTSQPVVPSGR